MLEQRKGNNQHRTGLTFRLTFIPATIFLPISRACCCWWCKHCGKYLDNFSFHLILNDEQDGRAFCFLFVFAMCDMLQVFEISIKKLTISPLTLSDVKAHVDHTILISRLLYYNVIIVPLLLLRLCCPFGDFGAFCGNGATFHEAADQNDSLCRCNVLYCARIKKKTWSLRKKSHILCHLKKGYHLWSWLFNFATNVCVCVTVGEYNKNFL